MVYSNQFNFVPFYCRFECFSISVSANDPHFRDPTKKCMTVIRSDAAPPLDCSTGIYSNSFKTHNITVSEYMLTVHKFRNEKNSFMKLKKSLFCCCRHSSTTKPEVFLHRWYYDLWI